MARASTPISATGPSNRTLSASASVRPAGFTLIEILVVMVIVGVMLGLAVLSVGSGGAAGRLEREAERVRALVTLAAREAVLNGREMGVAFESGGYRFYRYLDDGWQVLGEDAMLRPRSLPEGVTLEFSVDDVAVPLAGDDGDAEADRPQVLLLSSGEMTPFELTVRSADVERRIRLRADPLGRIAFSTGDGADE